MKDPITYRVNADRLIRMALEEDITSEDLSTNCVMPEYQKGEVQLICKQDGVIAGLGVFKRVFELLDDTVSFDMRVEDGDEVTVGQLMAVITGDIRALLSGERTALNYLQRMSGIATYTNNVAALLKGTNTKLLDTRKTTPCMRIFEKYAVRAGGGMMMLLILTSVLGYELKTAVGTSVFIMTFTALTGALNHFAIGGTPDLVVLILCIVSTLIFARVAAVLANKAPAKLLNQATGVILVILGAAIIAVQYVF